MIARGIKLRADQPVILHLLDIPPGIVATTNVVEACTGVNIAVMVGGFPRKDVMTKNVSIYKSQASVLEKHAAPNCKLQTVDDPNAQMALYISETKHSNTTIISFLTSRVKDINFLLFEFLCEESQIAADINLVTCSYYPSTENLSGGSRNNYPYVEIGLGATRAAITHLSNGVAHESAGADGAKGQRAMLVCRVSAGRVSKQLDLECY
ncbi:unnamed protein product [Malus baccata var. baccata]